MSVYRACTTRAVAFVVFSRDAQAIDRMQPYYTAPADTAAAALVSATWRLRGGATREFRVRRYYTRHRYTYFARFRRHGNRA